MPDLLVDDELRLNKERLKILYGAKPKKRISIPKPPPKFPKIDEQEISKTIDLPTKYYKMDNNVSDFLNPTQTLAEQAVYGRLYRLSIGYQKNICRIGMGALAKSINIKSSQKTVKRAIEGLIKKGHIKRFDTNKRGTLYQIFLPTEIKGVKNTIVNSTIVKNTIVNSTTPTVVKNTIPCSKKYYSQQKNISLTPLNTNSYKTPFFPKDIYKDIYKDNNRENNVVVNFFNQRFKEYQNTLTVKTINSLLEKYTLDKLLLYINRIPNDGSVRNPAGLLYKAIKNNWELTPTKEELIEKEKALKEGKFKAQQEKNKIERLNFEKTKAKEDQLNKLFNGLPKKEQNKLKDKAIEILRDEYPNIPPQTFNSIIATETMIMIKVWEILEKGPKPSKVEKDATKRIEEAFGVPIKFGE